MYYDYHEVLWQVEKEEGRLTRQRGEIFEYSSCFEQLAVCNLLNLYDRDAGLSIEQAGDLSFMVCLRLTDFHRVYTVFLFSEQYFTSSLSFCYMGVSYGLILLEREKKKTDP